MLLVCAPCRGEDPPSATVQLPVVADLFTDQPKGLSEKVFAWKLIYVGEVFGNPVGGEKQGAVYDGYAKFGIGINLEKAFGWEGGSFYANVLDPHGASLTQNDVHDLNVISNIDGYDSVRLYKLWFQQSLAGGLFSFRIGQMAADKEFFASDSSALFINNAFGTPPIFSQSIIAPIYPVSAPGIRLRWEPSPAFSIRTALFSGDVGTQTENQHETRIHITSQNGALMLLEASYKTNQADGSIGLPGTFKMGGYYDTKYFEDNRSESEHHGDGGAYFVADQEVYREPVKDGAARGLTAFARFGITPGDRNLVDHEVETGLNYVGLLRSRAADISGLGFAYTHLGATQVEASGNAVATHHEAIIEASYLGVVNSWSTLQPDVQYIFNPGGVVRKSNAVVLGLRVSLNF
jgi:porin